MHEQREGQPSRRQAAGEGTPPVALAVAKSTAASPRRWASEADSSRLPALEVQARRMRFQVERVLLLFDEVAAEAQKAAPRAGGLLPKARRGLGLPRGRPS